MWGVSTDRLLTLMKLAGIELLMLCLFCQTGFQMDNRLKVVREILCSRHNLLAHTSFNTLGPKKPKQTKIIPSGMQLVCHCLLFCREGGICWPNFFPFSALARLRRTEGATVLSGLQCQKSALREMWAVHESRQVLSGDLVRPCASRDHYSMS